MMEAAAYWNRQANSMKTYSEEKSDFFFYYGTNI